MNPAPNMLGVLSGEKELRIGIEKEDILMLSAGVFVAMLLALLISSRI